MLRKTFCLVYESHQSIAWCVRLILLDGLRPISKIYNDGEKTHAIFRLTFAVRQGRARAPGTPQNQNVTVPWASLDGGLIFDRSMNWFGQAMTQTLEPRAFYVYAPNRNQSQIPLFDTAVADFNYAQIFSENMFSGGDRINDANQLTAAVTSRLDRKSVV